jgi:hypothetical protein
VVNRLVGAVGAIPVTTTPIAAVASFVEEEAAARILTTAHPAVPVITVLPTAIPVMAVTLVIVLEAITSVAAMAEDRSPTLTVLVGTAIQALIVVTMTMTIRLHRPRHHHPDHRRPVRVLPLLLAPPRKPQWLVPSFPE